MPFVIIIHYCYRRMRFCVLCPGGGGISVMTFLAPDED